MAKKKYPKFNTPIGTARFPHLNKPDDFKGMNKYHCDLIVPGDDKKVKKLIASLEEQREAYLAEVKEELKEKGGKKAAQAKKLREHPICEDEYDDDGEPTGNVVFKLKMNASFEKGDRVVKMNPIIFDAKKNQLKNPPQIFGGSKLRFSGTAVPFYMASENLAGITLYMNAVQVVELVSFARDASDFGFGEEDGDELTDQEGDEPDDDNEPEGEDEGDDF